MLSVARIPGVEASTYCQGHDPLRSPCCGESLGVLNYGRKGPQDRKNLSEDAAAVLVEAA